MTCEVFIPLNDIATEGYECGRPGEYDERLEMVVCEEHKTRIACHPHDPGVPARGFQGVNRVLGTVEGLKKFVSIVYRNCTVMAVMTMGIDILKISA